MAFNFERFEHVGGKYTPKVSIRSNGQIGLSQGTLKRFNLLDGDWFVVLFYDKKEKAIGIKPTRDGDEIGAIKLIKKIQNVDGTDTATAFLSGKAFLEFNDIDYSKTRQHKAEYLAEEKMIIVRL